MKITRESYYRLNKGLVTYDPATAHRIFLRDYDDELHTASWRFYDAYETADAMHEAHYQLQRDQWRHNMYAAGTPDPKSAIATEADRAYYVATTKAANSAQN